MSRCFVVVLSALHCHETPHRAVPKQQTSLPCSFSRLQLEVVSTKVVVFVKGKMMTFQNLRRQPWPTRRICGLTQVLLLFRHMKEHSVKPN
ncbi:hypothetical protein DsansV1_C21g0167281 [Dioscorea sansibarensis]